MIYNSTLKWNYPSETKLLPQKYIQKSNFFLGRSLEVITKSNGTVSKMTKV